ncbi:MAG TPA: type VI secretion system baseplate subunit TssG [Bryobacteraceae bacterium]|nr:type VI secretion system baseplate subunit TssG [Bryobacteraceae bacterium]
MATEGGARDLAVIPADIPARLGEAPYSFEFFQAVRLLTRLASGRQPVGRFHAPSTEVVRFSPHATLTFPASEIQSLIWPEDGPPVMSVNFMGLTGPTGVLPLYYTELVMERLRARDTTLASFLDIFNHRAISLFHEAWEKYRFPVALERGEACSFTGLLLSLTGLGTPGLAGRQAVRDDSLVFYAGLLGPQPRSAAGLELLLADYFDVPVEVEQFVGVWRSLDRETQTRFEDAGDLSEQLGGGAVIGDEVWDLQSGVRLKLGPLPLDRYLDFLPSGTAYGPLKSITRFYAGDELDFEVQLILERKQVPACVLGAEGREAPRLGWATWVKSAPIGRDPADTILRL